jgi:hypothetical protein
MIYVIIGTIILIGVIIILALSPGPSVVKATVTQRSWDSLIIIEWSNGKIKSYIGSSTVWHEYPLMEQCDTKLEMLLYRINKYYRQHGNPFPTAHLTKGDNV